MKMQKIIPCLWFDNQAKEAVDFYISIFDNSSMGNISYYGQSGSIVSGMPQGSIMTITFKLNDQDFMALNGGPVFKFTEAISFMVMCENQEEIDYYWKKLTEGGEESVCGWLKDKYGLSWQIVPTILENMQQDPEAEKVERVMKAILKMKKLDIKKLNEAYGEK